MNHTLALANELALLGQDALAEQAYDAAVAFSAAEELVLGLPSLSAEDVGLLLREFRTNRRRSLTNEEYLAWQKSLELVQAFARD